MNCCHLELHLFLVTFFKRVSFTRFKDYRKCCNHFINLTLVQFRECENCWLWIATAPNSFAQVGTPGPRSLATPYSVQIFNSTQSVEGFFFQGSLLKNASWSFWSRKYSLKEGKCKCFKNTDIFFSYRFLNAAWNFVISSTILFSVAITVDRYCSFFNYPIWSYQYFEKINSFFTDLFI